MALIDKQARIIEDEWAYPDAEGGYTIRSYNVVPVNVLTSIGLAEPAIRPLGVFVPSGTPAEALVPYIGALDLIVVEFPKFRDGRGFTIARTLRARHGYAGDIRAIGHVLPDQFPALVQCGFSSVVLPAEHPVEQWRRDASATTRPAPGRPLVQRLLRGHDASGGEQGKL